MNSAGEHVRKPWQANATNYEIPVTLPYSSSGTFPAFLACSSSNRFHKGFSGTGTLSVWPTQTCQEWTSATDSCCQLLNLINTCFMCMHMYIYIYMYTYVYIFFLMNCGICAAPAFQAFCISLNQAGIARVPYLISCLGLRTLVLKSCTFTPIAGASSKSCLPRDWQLDFQTQWNPTKALPHFLHFPSSLLRKKTTDTAKACLFETVQHMP